MTLTGTYTGSGTVSVLAFERAGGAVTGHIQYDDSITGFVFETVTAHTLHIGTNSTAVLTMDGSQNASFSSTLAVAGVTTLSSDVYLAATQKLYLDGGTDTYITESAGDTMSFYTGGNLRLQINAGSLEVAVGYDLRINDT